MARIAITADSGNGRRVKELARGPGEAASRELSISVRGREYLAVVLVVVVVGGTKMIL